MIIGIISCVCALGCLVPYLGCVAGPLSIVGGILAVVFGFVGKSKNPTSGKAKAGIITGFIALGIDILMVIVAFVLGMGMAMMQK
ncbi:MAG TPA: hypothetical protein VHR66_00600 [Gemmataceae bacterium]|nr:hypothetical protein [Gemmataceae bacterium]